MKLRINNLHLISIPEQNDLHKLNNITSVIKDLNVSYTKGAEFIKDIFSKKNPEKLIFQMTIQEFIPKNKYLSFG